MPHPKGSPKTPGSGRKKGSRNRRTLTNREELWEYIEQLSTPDKSCNPFHRAVELLRDSEDVAILCRMIDFLGDRLMPKLKALEIDLGERAQQILQHRYGATDAQRNGDRAAV